MAGTIKQQLQAKAPQQRFTRTQRVAQQQQYVRTGKEIQELKQKADVKMQSTTPETYEQAYQELDDRIVQYYLSPQEYSALPEVQKYKEEKQKYDEIKADQEDYETAKRYSGYNWMTQFEFLRRATPRQKKYFLAIRQRDKALEDYYSPANVEQRASVKITPINQSELVAVGQASNLLVRNVGESDASYNYRLAQLGKEQSVASPQYSQEAINRARIVADVGNFESLPYTPYKEALYQQIKPQPVSSPRTSVLQKTQLQFNPEELIRQPTVKPDLSKSAGNLFYPVASTIIKAYDKIPSTPVYFGATGVSPFKFTKYDVSLSDFAKETKRRADIKLEDIETETISKEKTALAEQELLAGFQQEIQPEFERKYGEDIFVGRTTFEDAVKDFETTPFYKRKTTEFEEKWADKQVQLYQEVGFKSKTKALAKSIPFSLTKLAMFPLQSSKDLALTGVVLFTAPKLLAKIPSKAIVGAELGLATYGTATFLSPKSSYSKSIAGGTMGVIAFASLGSSAVKLYKAHKFKPVDVRIEEPFLKTLKSRKVVSGVEQPLTIKKVSLKGQTIVKEQVVYPSSIQIKTAEGFRREWYTLKDYTLKKYFGMPTKPYYSGVTSYAKPSTMDFGFFKYTKVSSRQVVANWLKSLGNSQAQISKLLRYSASRTEITKRYGSADIFYGDKIKSSAKGQMIEVTTKPKLLLDKDLNIVTRGGKTVKKIAEFEKTVIGTSKTGRTIIDESIVKTSGYVTKKKFVEIPKQTEIIQRRVSVKASEVLERPLFVKTPVGNEVINVATEKYKYQILRADSLTTKLKLSKNVKDFLYKPVSTIYSKSEMALFKARLPKTLTIKEAELFKLKYGIDVSYKAPKEIVKTPKRTVMSPSDAEKLRKDMLKDILKDKKDWQQLNKATQNKILQRTTKQFTVTDKRLEETIQQSKYAGTGLYERTESVAGISDKFSPIQTRMKTDAVALKMQEAQLQQSFARVKPTAFSVDTTRSLSSLFASSVLRSSSRLNQSLKLQIQSKIDTGIKADTGSKLDTGIKLDTGLRLSSNLQTSPQLTQPTITTPIPRTPVTPKPPTAPIIPFVLPSFDLFGKQIVKDKLKSKKIESFALFPDFTTRIVGLSPKEYSEKELEKEAKLLQTGFEIRRGGIVKKTRGRPKKADANLIKQMRVPKDMNYLKNAVKNAMKVKW